MQHWMDELEEKPTERFEVVFLPQDINGESLVSSVEQSEQTTTGNTASIRAEATQMGELEERPAEWVEIVLLCQGSNVASLRSPVEQLEQKTTGNMAFIRAQVVQ